MGFLSDLATLTRRAHDVSERMDMGATLAAAQESLHQAERVMAAMVVADDAALEVARVRATATVVDARQLPMMLGMDSVVELDLTVVLASGIPLAMTRTEQVAPLQLARVTPGAQLPVSLVPGRPASLRVEWGA
ncbi:MULTISPECIES: hypothetical protein [unclassified Agromyces]|uniref:hypothetical protein n=1 Tax=unclassified Agromyces TaxID=2639701 RepID=UPI003014FE9F